jgi:hypothetical protein
VNPQTLQKVWLTVHTGNTTLNPQCRILSNNVNKPILGHKTFHQLTRGIKLWNVNFGLSFGIMSNGYKILSEFITFVVLIEDFTLFFQFVISGNQNERRFQHGANFLR